jgi:pSer/pThr/pTyr-binding forkhead associated (FHA) protein
VVGTDVFLSYSRDDRAAAKHIAHCFGSEGINVWWDAALQSGQTFDEVIETRLREAKAVVVLWSPRSVASRWVRAEATLADRQNKLVPAIIENCDRPIAFELTHTADLTEWSGDASDSRWQDFVDDVRRLVEREVDVAPAVPAAKTSRPPASSNLSRFADPPIPRPQRVGPQADDITFAMGTHSAASAPAVPEDAQEEFHCLRLSGGELGEDMFVLGSASLKIGRSAPADIVLAHPSISREHCLIGLANDELLVTDLNSTNGTFVDGQRVGRATILPVGAVLKVGQLTLTHETHTREETSRSNRPAKTSRGSGFRPRLAAAP